MTKVIILPLENFNIFFELEHINQNFKNKSIALIIPQPSLCGRIRKIFDKIDLGDANIRIFSPIQFGKCDDNFDITLVDEAHLLKVGVTGTLGKQVHEIDQKIFGDTALKEEMAEGKKAAGILGGRVEQVISFQLPGTDYNRTLVQILKEKHTSGKYPRKAGTPAKDPLGK